MKLVPLLLVILASVVATSCAPKSVREIQQEIAEENSGKVRLSEIRTSAPQFDVKEVLISRGKFQKAFHTSETGVQGRTGFDMARVVRVFERSATAAPYPIYRIFQVIPDSPFAQLGLKNGDVLVGAEDCVLASGDAFKKYVSLLQWEKSAEIELRREGKSVLIKAKIVD
jgi:S1-C subfamily serine protease